VPNNIRIAILEFRYMATVDSVGRSKHQRYSGQSECPQWQLAVRAVSLGFGRARHGRHLEAKIQADNWLRTTEVPRRAEGFVHASGRHRRRFRAFASNAV
jgi:hypothetical protein